VVSEVRYARSGNVNIAYRVAGDGPFDVVFIPGTTSHVELAWDVPFLRTMFDRIASFARLIVFDKRGTGMSDAAPADSPLEVRMDDVRAVMDAAGSQRAAVFGVSEGSAMSILFAATHPERAWALVLQGGEARHCGRTTIHGESMKRRSARRSTRRRRRTSTIPSDSPDALARLRRMQPTRRSRRSRGSAARESDQLQPESKGPRRGGERASVPES
jgi:pimeloyl-ACP methyl ester carboxylesterase